METLITNRLHETGFENFQAIVYRRENITKFPNHPFAAIVIQKTPKGRSKSRIMNHFVYKTEPEATSFADKTITQLRNMVEDKRKKTALKREQDKEVLATDFYSLGDIVVNVWGWEQTNVEFYQVTKTTNRTITVRSIKSEVVEGSEGHMSCNVTALKDNFTEETKEYRLTVKSKGYLSNPQSYYHFSKWDGRPQYRSWYA